MPKDIITKLKQSGLAGRGGACYPTWMKWQAVHDAFGLRKFVVVNGSEGEEGVRKDHHILENHPGRLVDGIKIALEYLDATKAFVYLNPVYFKAFEKKLGVFIKDAPIVPFAKPHNAGYIGGEETAALNAIEGRRIEPRLKPPFPTDSGLWEEPTLINNIETFYHVSLINSGNYEGKRFYTIGGDCPWNGVYEFPEDWPVARVLKETGNYPDYDFFVQVGGDASGEVLSPKELDRPAGGGATITVYSTQKHEPLKLIRRWVEFFANESCGQCTPCREGTYRLKELLSATAPDWKLVAEVLDALRDSSFCGLGCAVPVPIDTYVRYVLSAMPDNAINLPAGAKQAICECFGI